MKKELIIKKCLKCGATIKVIKDCECAECGLICCNEKMVNIKANSTEAAIEKHVPNYEVEQDKIKVIVNHVMEREHFIEWICLVSENREEYIYLKPNEEATAIFENTTSGTLYAYCNKHGLWKKEIE